MHRISPFYLCIVFKYILWSLQWRHNEHDGVSNPDISIVCSTVCSGADQGKHQNQSSISLVFFRGIHRYGRFPSQGPVKWKMFPFDDVIMCLLYPTQTNKTALKALIMALGSENICSFLPWQYLVNLNTLKPRRSGRCFADSNLQGYFWIKKVLYFDSNPTEVCS